jgi:hypothetical protein
MYHYLCSCVNQHQKSMLRNDLSMRNLLWWWKSELLRSSSPQRSPSDRRRVELAPGLIWGYPGGSANPNDGNRAKPQADLAEFTIGARGQDSYDISAVNAYNLPLLINPTTIAPPGQRRGLECGTPICSIGNIASFCRSPNFQTGPTGFGCYNVDGPGPVATAGTEEFANACPHAYSYSNDNANHVYGCPTGSNYEVVFCP